MNRMETNTLRDLVWYAIDDACDGDLVSRSEATTNVLAALGLDDLDAAIERAAWVLVDALPGHGTPIHDLYGPAAEKALKAAFTATPESENT